MRQEIYLIRHGESEINYMLDSTSKENHILAGATFWAELTDKGKTQSRMVAKYLYNNGIEFDKIATSPYVRTEQTLRYYMEERHCIDQLCKRLSGIEIVPDLREHFQGDWEGLNKIESGYSEHLKTISIDPESFLRFKCPNGESPEDVGKRAGNYIRNNILNKGFSRTGVFTHRGTITWLTNYFLPSIPIDELFRNDPKPASVTLFVFESDILQSYEPNIFVPTITSDKRC
jgi:broad specificity phosphatase PhoE